MENIRTKWDFDNPLSDLSPKDNSWDAHRLDTQKVQNFYVQDTEFQKYAERLGGCSTLLKFAPVITDDKAGLKLKYAFFCRVRHCPVCQWRRSMLWRARMFSILPKILEEHQGGRWLFLTLTVKNCPITELRDTLQDMNKAWNRLRLRKEFKHIIGWIRTTEVTRNAKDGTAHPHFHALLLVKPSYFKGQNYIKQTRWRELWQETAQLDYDPFVHVQAVKAGIGQDALSKAVCETLKYSVKPSDLVQDAGWFLELTRQTHKLRFIATGGVLKGCLASVEDATNEEMLVTGAEEESTDTADNGVRLAFGWQSEQRRYYHRPDLDENANDDDGG